MNLYVSKSEPALSLIHTHTILLMAKYLILQIQENSTTYS